MKRTIPDWFPPSPAAPRRLDGSLSRSRSRALSPPISAIDPGRGRNKEIKRWPAQNMIASHITPSSTPLSTLVLVLFCRVVSYVSKGATRVQNGAVVVDQTDQFRPSPSWGRRPSFSTGVRPCRTFRSRFQGNRIYNRAIVNKYIESRGGLVTYHRLAIIRIEARFRTSSNQLDIKLASGLGYRSPFALVSHLRDRQIGCTPPKQRSCSRIPQRHKSL